MANSPTRRGRNIYDRVIDSLEASERTFIQGLKAVSSESSVVLSGIGGGGSVGGTGGSTSGGQYLPIAGGTMIGPIAYNPKPISSFLDGAGRGHINISKDTGRFTSNVILNGIPSSWNLSYIDGDYWDGQILRIHVPETYTLRILTDGNVDMPVSKLDVKGPSYVELMFDSTVAPNGNQGGWEVTNPAITLDGCEVATKCYVLTLLAVAGFLLNSANETISENAEVVLFTNVGDMMFLDSLNILETGQAMLFTNFGANVNTNAEQILENALVTVI